MTLLARIAPDPAGDRPTVVFPLPEEALRRVDAYWRGSNVLLVGQIHLRGCRPGPLVRRVGSPGPLTKTLTPDCGPSIRQEPV